MRARALPGLGWVLVLGYAAVAIWVTATTTSIERPSSDRTVDPGERFVEAWERSRRGTFVTTGTFERRSDVTGAAIRSEDVVAQRPPRRLHRQLGGVDGRDDDRLVVCPAVPPDQEDDRPQCHLGAPGGRTYEESVAREVEALRTIVSGPDRLYDVAVDDEGCFDLEQRRPDPRAPFGVGARFCFHDGTGAPVRTEVRYEGGVREVTLVDDVRADVTDDDLEP